MTSEEATARIETPVGVLRAVVDERDRLVRLSFDDAAHDWSDTDGLRRVRAALGAYFEGDRNPFEGLELGARGTDFQDKVWAALCRIPYGTTCSYGQLAAAIGQPTASRAVGMANNANPIAIIVPCHRVIGASGKLVGYASGLDHKRALLAHEQRDSLLFT